MKEEMIKLWMPLQKDINGGFVGILSDNSIDRDGEFMTKELLQSWVKDNRPLPMLANHENKLEKLIGGWTNKELKSNGDNTAMTAEPFFLESNPLGKQAKAMVEEALSKGLGIGISIGAIPKGEMVEKDINGEKFKGYTEAEILEATIVPIQSNRNASFAAVAKSFDINIESKEEIKVDKEIQKEIPVEAPIVEEIKKEAEEECKKEEEAPVAEEPAAEAEPSEAEKSLAVELKKAQEEIEKLKKQSVLKATVESQVVVKKEFKPTILNMLKAKYGGQ
jgi:hypothetical protein